MEQRGQSKRACNLPSRDRGRPKVNCTNDTDFYNEEKSHADCADNADCCHTESTEITERYLTTNCTNNTDIFHAENAENAEKKGHADLADNADCCHTESTESTEITETKSSTIT